MKEQLNEVRRLQELAGMDDRTAEFNSLENDNVFDDVPAIEMTIQTDERNEDVLFMIMKGNEALQQQVMELMQAEMQRTFRRVIHSILGEPNGIPEIKK